MMEIRINQVYKDCDTGEIIRIDRFENGTWFVEPIFDPYDIWTQPGTNWISEDTIHNYYTLDESSEVQKTLDKYEATS